MRIAAMAIVASLILAAASAAQQWGPPPSCGVAADNSQFMISIGQTGAFGASVTFDWVQWYHSGFDTTGANLGLACEEITLYQSLSYGVVTLWDPPATAAQAGPCNTANQRMENWCGATLSPGAYMAYAMLWSSGCNYPNGYPVDGSKHWFTVNPPVVVGL